MKLCTLFFGLLLANLPVLAQPGAPPPHEESEKVKALRTAYITQKLNLTVAESEKFWPIYNEFQQNVNAQHRRRFDAMRKVQDEQETLTDAQFEELVKQSMDAEEKIAALRKTYHERFRKVLSAKKVALMYAAEVDFQRKVIQQIHKRAERGRP
ncbi:periplasmic heavy metal sensor [bacterium]|nr:periplasmic heavy metal sensor [bacterium]